MKRIYFRCERTCWMFMEVPDEIDLTPANIEAAVEGGLGEPLASRRDWIKVTEIHEVVET